MNVTLGDTRGAAGPMSLTVSPSTAPAGDVTFVVKNTGTIEHEAVVLKTNVAYNKLPVNNGGDPPAPVKTGADKVSEDTNIGETGDPNLKPGDTRTFTIKNMTAGQLRHRLQPRRPLRQRHAPHPSSCTAPRRR